MYTGSLILTRKYVIFVFSEPIEVKVGLLFENMLTGCTITESKCSRVTQHLEFHTARRRPTLNQVIGGVDTIKACT